MVSKEEWDEYSKYSRLILGHKEYLQATKDITSKLIEIVNTSTPEDIKEQINDLVSNRLELIRYGDSHHPTIR